MLSHIQRATKDIIFVWVCLKQLRSCKNYAVNTSEKFFRLTHGQLSPINTQQSARGYPMIVNNIQPCPKRCLQMLLKRELTLPCVTANARHGQFPCTCIGIVGKTWHKICSMHRGFCTLVVFIAVLFVVDHIVHTYSTPLLSILVSCVYTSMTVKNEKNLKLQYTPKKGSDNSTALQPSRSKVMVVLCALLLHNCILQWHITT